MRLLPWISLLVCVSCQPHAIDERQASSGPTNPKPGLVARGPSLSPEPASPARPSTTAVAVGTNPGRVGAGTPLVAAPGNELAAFAEGCFWGAENTFRHVPGVVATAVGYTGGRTPRPTYDSVSSHTTGHAETVLVEFDPRRVTYAELLQHFWESHDPTTKNRQGPDVGDNYRSAIFTFSAEQAKAARDSLASAQARFSRPITTEIRPIGPFYRAEEFHQQYDEKHDIESCPMPVVKRGI